MKQVSLILSQPSTDYADAFNRATWRLSRPESVNDMYCTRSVHPTDGRVALNFIEDDTQPVHPDADVDAYMEMLEPVLDPDATIDVPVIDENGELVSTFPEPEPEAIRQMITAALGGRINILEILQTSPTLSPSLRTREQMVQAGWYPTNDEV